MGFDFANLKVTDVTSMVVNREITSIPIRKPKPGIEFFRIRLERVWHFTKLNPIDTLQGE